MARICVICLCCVLMLFSLAATVLAAEPDTLVSASFAKDAWSPGDWILAKAPTATRLGKWVQRDNCIENEVPADPALLRSFNETLTTMVYNKQLVGDLTVSGTLEIGPGAAPGFVVVQDLAPDAEGRPQYGEFYELILYEKGINLWHHFLRDGKPTHELTAYCRFPLKADTPYRLTLKRKAKTLEISVEGHQIGVLIPTLTPGLFLGVEGCEGICRIHDFTITR